MRVCISNLYQCFNTNDSIFDLNSYSIGENLGYPMLCLKNEFEKQGHEIHTIDHYPSYKTPDAYVFVDRPENIGMLSALKEIGKKLYLIICEPEIIQPINYDPIVLNYFDKVFTTNKSLVDFRKIIEYYPANKIPSNEQLQENIDTASSRHKMVCMIAGNKMVAHPKQLYSERLNAIRWFQDNRPKNFDLYGTGWSKENYPSYKGAVKSKFETLKQYRFQICYENAHSIPGYVTEKIFDSLFAGTIPVYLGDKNIRNIVPEDCFIDKRKYGSYQHLYNYLNSMSLDKYKRYLRCIYKWIASGSADLYSGEYFAKKIVGEITND